MNRYTVPIGFALAAIWVAFIFMLVSAPTH
jgi:hypothetical protein